MHVERKKESTCDSSFLIRIVKNETRNNAFKPSELSERFPLAEIIWIQGTWQCSFVKKKKKKNIWVLSVASRALQFEKQSTKRGRCCTYEEKVNVQMADSFCFVRSSRQRIYLQMRKNLIFAFTFLPHLPPFSSFFDDNLYQNRFNDLHEERDLKYFSYIEFCAYYSSFYYSIYGVLETYNYLFRIP